MSLFKKVKKEEKKYQIPLKNISFETDTDYDYEKDDKVYCIRCEYYLDAIAGERCTHPKANTVIRTSVAAMTYWDNHRIYNKNNDCKWFKLEHSL